jgi:hypothetical protein
VLFTHHQVREDEVGRACNTNGEEQEEEDKKKIRVYRLMVGEPETKRAQGVGKWIILRWMLERYDNAVLTCCSGTG